MLRVLGSQVLHIDGSGLRVLDRNHPEHIRKGAMRCYVGRELRLVIFKFISDANTDGPVAMLKNRVGYVVADADLQLNTLFGRADATAIEVGCNMHARRYYAKALDAGDRRRPALVHRFTRPINPFIRHCQHHHGRSLGARRRNPLRVSVTACGVGEPQKLHGVRPVF